MIKQKVKELMQQVFEINSVPDDISQNCCENWDSLKHLALAVAIEETFKISLEPDEIEKMISLDIIINLIDRKLQ
jgi:acyl carrier protein